VGCVYNTDIDARKEQQTLKNHSSCQKLMQSRPHSLRPSAAQWDVCIGTVNGGRAAAAGGKITHDTIQALERRSAACSSVYSSFYTHQQQQGSLYFFPPPPHPSPPTSPCQVIGGASSRGRHLSC